jgi:hypothetical protein
LATLSSALVLGSAAASAHTDRFNCDAIRGTDYESEDERAWFLANCIGGSSAVAPVIIYYVPEVFIPAGPTQRPSAPGVVVTCNSSIATATANEDTQQVPLAAFAGELIYCSAFVNGYYSSIDWAGGQVNGSGPNFTTSFGFRTTPWTIRVQVNWGGNPVIKYISVNTVGAGCLPGAPFCIVR